eukprot:851353_1
MQYYDRFWGHRDDEWFIQPNVGNIEKYKHWFKIADLKKDGVIDGNEANKFFSKSKLNRKSLAILWTMVDVDKKGKIGMAGFCVMFHMVLLIKKTNYDVPKKLPKCLTVKFVDTNYLKIETE